MLLVFLRTVVAAGERKHQRVVALEFAELAQCAHVIRQLVVGKMASGQNVGTHDFTPSISGTRCRAVQKS